MLPVRAASLALAAVAAVAAPTPCFNVDQVYSDQRNTTQLYPNGGFVVTARACQQACEAKGPSCKYYSWRRTFEQMGSGACWLREEVTGLVGKATTISGPQSCDPGDAGGVAESWSEHLVTGTLPGVPALGALPTVPAAGALPTFLPPLPGLATTVPAVQATTGLTTGAPTAELVGPGASTTPEEVVRDRNATDNATGGAALGEPTYAGGTFPWWGLLLVALGVAACGSVVLLFSCEGDERAGKKKSRKSKRSAEVEGNGVRTRGIELLDAEAAPMLAAEKPMEGPDVFDLIDQDRDGQINYEDFVRAMGGAQAPAAPLSPTAPVVPVQRLLSGTAVVQAAPAARAAFVVPTAGRPSPPVRTLEPTAGHPPPLVVQTMEPMARLPPPLMQPMEPIARRPPAPAQLMEPTAVPGAQAPQSLRLAAPQPGVAYPPGHAPQAPLMRYS
mmetsp:Transcript_5291/g.15664  ORF Transcript_5291/g.15664 Transcript_5291/m.15664 type:complete len:445 (-) Transcript_5291:68-1402(-)